MQLELLFERLRGAIGHRHAQAGQHVAAERDHLRAPVELHDLIELRQVEVDEAGAVGKTIVR